MFSIAKKGLFALLALAGMGVWSQAKADRYQTWYPAYYGPPPVVQEWVPPPYYGPAPPYRVYERWSGTPNRPRFRYEEKYPGGLEYKYRVDTDNGRLRIREKWDD